MAGKTPISPRIASAIALVAALTACGQPARQTTIANETDVAALPALPDVQPLAAGPAAPIRPAPSLASLPRARPLGYAMAPENDRYAWIDRADWISDTIGDAPPDYYFDYDGVEPWVWQTRDDYLTYAEPIDGGYRYYYYEPGADVPYLVRDPSYSYGYRDGRIATVHDRDGRLLAPAEAARQADAASRYYARARALRAAGADGPQHGVTATQWAARRPAIAAARSAWRTARERDAGWRAYRDQHAAVERQQLQPERIARTEAADRFAAWQRDGLRGPAPQLYRPREEHRAEGRDGGAKDQAPIVPADRARRPEGPRGPAAMAARRTNAPDRAATSPQGALREQARRAHAIEPQAPHQRAPAIAIIRPADGHPAAAPRQRAIVSPPAAEQRRAPQPERGPRDATQRLQQQQAEGQPVAQRPAKPQRATERTGHAREQAVQRVVAQPAARAPAQLGAMQRPQPVARPAPQVRAPQPPMAPRPQPHPEGPGGRAEHGHH